MSLDAGRVRVHRVTCAADFGQIANPSTVHAQVAGSVVTGLSAAFYGEITLERGRVVSREELLQKIWGRRPGHRDRTVDVFVRRLRRKLDVASARHDFIQTRYGVGYKLEPTPK